MTKEKNQEGNINVRQKRCILDVGVRGGLTEKVDFG